MEKVVIWIKVLKALPILVEFGVECQLVTFSEEMGFCYFVGQCYYRRKSVNYRSSKDNLIQGLIR